MGCDGGTIPRRSELVRMKKKPEQKDKDAERSFKWRNCALSQQPLQEPVVACGLGRLYSKNSVLEVLLDGETKPDFISHIESLEDIKDLKLVKNPAYTAADHTHGDVGAGNVPYICPVSGLEMSGKFRFVFLWNCGCVLAERALKEVRQNLCHMCQQPFTDNDVVPLNGTDDDIKKLKEKMALRVASRESSKETKTETTLKTKVKLEPLTPGPSTSTKVSTDVIKPENGIKKSESGPSSRTAVKKEKIKTIPLSLPRYNPNQYARGHFGSRKRAHPTELAQDPSYKKTKKEYSVAKDPQTSEVFKSLFTSHQSNKNQQRAHWVTYNPFYN
ncbi:protein RTF2 homolog [Spodoptera litura]|uniref:Replication termination factor 2 n=1 Tax=Spodoptera litura TaxID=69820 RepID=A0A9J7IU29_SPOLT|nr:protein RTF2 homolog [Spodoptera litura]